MQSTMLSTMLITMLSRGHVDAENSLQYCLQCNTVYTVYNAVLYCLYNAVFSFLVSDILRRSCEVLLFPPSRAPTLLELPPRPTGRCASSLLDLLGFARICLEFLVLATLHFEKA